MINLGVIILLAFVVVVGGQLVKGHVQKQDSSYSVQIK